MRRLPRIPPARWAPAVLLVLAGCYEIKPQVSGARPAGGGQPGWPPPAVYSLDPFHPANRLFQRLFVLDGDSSSPPAGAADGPLPARESLSPVDQAECLGLLEELEKGEESAAALSPVGRALLQSDLLWFLARVRFAGELGSDLARELAAAARSLEPEETLPPFPLPPPLRSEGWTEAPGPFHGGLRPSREDLRWSKVHRRDGDALLLRLRVGEKAGEPVLLPLASEAWLLTRSKEGPPAPRIYHFRRGKVLRGEDPWEEVPSGTAVKVLDPEDPLHPPVSGRLPALCTGCHPGPGLEARSAAQRVEPAASPSGQLEDARRALTGPLGN